MAKWFARLSVLVLLFPRFAWAGDFTINTAAGDITSVGDCTTGACFTGTTGSTQTFIGSNPSLILTDSDAGGKSFEFNVNGTGLFLAQTSDNQQLMKWTNGSIYAPGLVSCDTIDTTADGKLICGTDTAGAGGGDPVLIDGVAVADASGVDIQGGVGVDITFNAGASPDTASFVTDFTEISSLTWGSAGNFTTMTFDAGATDPVLTAASGALTVTTGTLGVTGASPQFILTDNDAGAKAFEWTVNGQTIFLANNTDNVQLLAAGPNNAVYLPQLTSCTRALNTGPDGKLFCGDGVNGSGADERITVWSGTSTQTGYSNFVWDDENTAMGVGDNDPATNGFSLHVLRNQSGDTGIGASNNTVASGASAFIQTRNGANTLAQLRTNNSAASNADLTRVPSSSVLLTGTSTTGGLILDTLTTAPIIFATGGAATTNERARITAEGLDVSGTTPAITITDTDAGAKKFEWSVNGLTSYFANATDNVTFLAMGPNNAVYFPQLTTCDLKTGADGKVYCGTDAGGSATPGGSNTQVQYNTSGSFGGSSGLTLNATQITDLTFNTGAIASADLTTGLSDEQGSGAAVFATSPTLTTPTIGAATATSIAIGANTLNTTEWAFLDGQDQSVFTTSSPTFANAILAGTGPDLRLNPSGGDSWHFGAESGANGGVAFISNVTDGTHYIRFTGAGNIELPGLLSCGSLFTGADGRMFCGAAGGGSGTVTSITQGTGMSFSVNPITTTGTINLATPVAIANGGTNNTAAYTANSVIFSDGTKLTEDTANFLWNDASNFLRIGGAVSNSSYQNQATFNGSSVGGVTGIAVQNSAAGGNLWGVFVSSTGATRPAGSLAFVNNNASAEVVVGQSGAMTLSAPNPSLTLTDADAGGKSFEWNVNGDTAYFSNTTDNVQLLAMGPNSAVYFPQLATCTLKTGPDGKIYCGVDETGAAGAGDITDVNEGTAIDVTNPTGPAPSVAWDSTEVEATTWGAGGNASNIWSVNLSGTDHTITFGSNLTTFSGNVTVTNSAPLITLTDSDGGGSSFEITANGPSLYIADATNNTQLISMGPNSAVYLPQTICPAGLATAADGKVVCEPATTACAAIPDVVAADDNFLIWVAPAAVTIRSIWCRYEGTGTTVATFALEDAEGNAMTHTAPTCTTGAALAGIQPVTAANTLSTGEGLRFDVSNTPNPTTDDYAMCFAYTVN
jgi:hypothetical protein